MMGFPKHTRVYRDFGKMRAEHLAQMEAGEEAELVHKVAFRNDTSTLVVENGDTGEIVAYAVMGPDLDGIVTVYAARCMLKGLGPILFKQLFGAAQVLGKPFRVHTDRVKVMAKAIGAEHFAEELDTNGLPNMVAYG